MRSEQTEHEIVVGDILLRYLESIDKCTHVIEREINDRPDFAFMHKGQRIGCECTQIPPSKIFKFLRMKLKQLKGSDYTAVRVVWPYEPHIWTRDAIKEKSKKAGAYKKNINADEIWLLLHGPTNIYDMSLPYEHEYLLEFIRLTAAETDHNFKNIYWWDIKNGLHHIFPFTGTIKQLRFDCTKGYPTYGFTQLRTSFKTTEHGEPPKEYDFSEIIPNNIIIPPSDPEFRRHPPRISTFKYHPTITAHDTRAEYTYKYQSEDASEEEKIIADKSFRSLVSTAPYPPFPDHFEWHRHNNLKK